MTIKNIVFDVGNVLVRWDPHFIVAQAFPNRSDHAALVSQIFKHQIWLDINLGRITQEEAIVKFQAHLGIDLAQLSHMMAIAKQSLIPLQGSADLLKSLDKAGYHLYALTDNTKVFVEFLEQYDFWKMFKGTVVSANVGYLKPAPEIYRHLLVTYQLNKRETLFIDDYLCNVEGALAVGIDAFQFKDVDQCIQELRKKNVIF